MNNLTKLRFRSALVLKNRCRFYSEQGTGKGKEDEGEIKKKTDIQKVFLSPKADTSIVKKYKVTDVDRRYLVWSGQYKRKEDVPEFVEDPQLHKARGWARIRINLCLVAFFSCFSVAAAMLGKGEAEKGRSLTQQNLAWHKENQEKK